MVWKKIFLGLVALFFIFLILVYWLVPFDNFKFDRETSPEFNVGNISLEMQFYDNMRFPDSKISYRIDETCSIKKKDDMVKAFEYLGERTILEFFPTTSGEEISVSCEDKAKTSKSGLFIAGEGGPTEIISGENFNVISKGQILLLRDSSCERPNVGIHELLHVLGFDHSENENNIMYPVSDCSQTIGNEIVSKINELYVYPSLPDLKIEELSAETEGRYLNLNLSVRNIGLVDSSKGKIFVHGDEEKIKEVELEELKVGYGIEISFFNIWIPERKTEKIKVSIDSGGNELSLENNQIVLSKIHD